MPEKRACDLLVTADWIVTQDDVRTIIRDGFLAVAEGCIVGLGPVAGAGDFDPAKRLDLPGRLILPGLVNAHCHAAMTLLRGLADDMALEEWLTRHIWPAEARLGPEEVHAGALVAAAEMLASGTTCFFDGYFFQQRTADAAEAAGIRAVLGEGLLAFGLPSYATIEQGFALAEELAARCAKSPLLRANIFPHAVSTTTPEILRESFALAERLDCAWSLHLAETEAETAAAVATHGKRPVECLRDWGLLAPRSLLVHCVDLTPGDVAIIAESGAAVAHCSQSNLKLGCGIAPVAPLRAAGVRVGLGTDGAASNNSLNPFTEMKSAALAAKGVRRDPALLPAQVVLDMATREAADAIGWPELGRLAPGGPADFAALDFRLPHLTPVHDPVSHLVYAAQGSEVELTVVAGRVVYRQGEFTGIDWPGARREAGRMARRLRPG